MKKLLRKKNVVGFGRKPLRDGRVPVLVSRKESLDGLRKEDLVPKIVRTGFFRWHRTDVLEVGRVEPQADRRIYRPVIGGCEIGVVGELFVGTVGGVVYYEEYQNRPIIGSLLKSFKRLFKHFGVTPVRKLGLLTNNHVVNRNVLVDGRGAEIVQSGLTKDKIGVVAYTLPLSSKGDNELDVAVITPSATVSHEVKQVGVLTGVRDPDKNERFHKYGRTTEYTEGAYLLARDVNLFIDYGLPAGSLFFKGVDMYTKFSEKGDSGSIIASMLDNKAVGLLFAGSSNYTFACPMTKVVDELGIELV